jgi:hypothetical protein
MHFHVRALGVLSVYFSHTLFELPCHVSLPKFTVSASGSAPFQCLCGTPPIAYGHVCCMTAQRELLILNKYEEKCKIIGLRLYNGHHAN